MRAGWQSSGERLPAGWSARLEQHVAELEARLADDGGYFSAKDRRIADLEGQLDHWRTLQRLTEREVRSLKRSWSYRVGRVVVFPASVARGLACRLLDSIRDGAARVVSTRAAGVVRPGLPEEHSLARRRAWAAACAALTVRPRVSVVVPVRDTPPALLREALGSVLDQAYPHWELCVADDGSTCDATRRVLAETAAANPGRMRTTRLPSPRGIAAASNAAAGQATGDYLAFLDHDDRLTPDALLRIAEAIEAAPDADLLYSDEDKLDRRGRTVEPFHKPGFSPTLLLACNYLCHLTVIRRRLFRGIGGFRTGFDGAQDHDLVLRAAEAARRVVHVPRILYHWRKTPGSTAADARAKGGPWREPARRALGDAVRRRGLDARVEDGAVPGTYRVRPAVDPAERVTIVIPTRDRLDLLGPCVEAIRRRTVHRAWEILIVDHGSEEPRTTRYLDALRRSARARVIRDDGPFNYSRLNNLAARATDAPFLLFLNNDTEALVEGWLEALLAHGRQPDVGAVGARLQYPDGSIQHAGIVLGLLGVAGHAFRGTPPGSPGYFGLAEMVRDVSAVTGACLLTRREVFEQVGGFDEQLAVAFNDVDYCLKVRERGYRVVYTPDARLLHRESGSRAPDDGPERSVAFHGEILRLRERWRERLRHDPFYNPNLSRWHEDYRAREPDEPERERRFERRFSPPAKPAQDRRPRHRRRNGYKTVWNSLARSESGARRHVIGEANERELRREARRTLEVLESTVGVAAGDVVLEIGCGMGRVGEVLAPRCRRWIGCDVSSRMLAHARRRLSSQANVELLEISGFDLRPLEEASVDLVYCTVVFMHLDEWDRYGYVREARRVLRPGGRVYVDNVNLLSDEGWRVFESHRAIPPERRPEHISKSSTPPELAAYLRRAGFRDVQVEECGPWVRCWGAR